ncbi:hypothetical protein [Poseidonibacter antarcticus]|nr:hypothetical protein [Poseidonibacter antarcticus]
MKKQTIKIPKLKQRVTWGFNPVTRTIKSKKLYSRKNCKIEF